MKARLALSLALLALAAGCAAPDPAAVRQDCRAQIRRAERAGKTDLAEELRADCAQPGVSLEPAQGPIPPEQIAPPGLHDQGAEETPVNDPDAALQPSIDGR